MDASAAFWTVARVGSTLAQEVIRSEAWNPLLKAIGCFGVLAMLRPSADIVASLHGSPICGYE